MSKNIRWRKSTFSAEGNCVEMARFPDGRIAMRNSKHPGRGITMFTREEIDAFLRGVKAGQFDDLS